MRTLIFLIILYAPLCAKADDTTLHRLPTVETTELEGIPHKCLDVDEWKSVLLMARAYQGLYMWRLEIRGVLVAHDQIVISYELKVSNFEAMLKIKDADLLYYKTRLKESQAPKTAARIEKYLLWGIILIETVTIGALGVYR